MKKQLTAWIVILMSCVAASASASYDVVVVGGTPGGITAAVAAAREGKNVLVLERGSHLGGLPANGLGATDITTRGATTGLFTEFVNRNKEYYVSTYGAGSEQVKVCSDGYHFEPSVAERTLLSMIGDYGSLITVLYNRQFDSDPANVIMDGDRIRSVRILDRTDGSTELYEAGIFIDATYEGDLGAAANVPYRVGRESRAEYGEPCAGKIYRHWGVQFGGGTASRFNGYDGFESEGTTYQGDNAVQAYNYRLCLTADKDNMRPVTRPENYDREEYASIVEDVWTGRHTGIQMESVTPEQMEANRRAIKAGGRTTVPGDPWGMAKVTNMVALPNSKTDANNQHMAFLSTDLPEENWAWPTASWEWRDRFAKRLRDYTLGLLWFVQNDKELPASFRKECRRWGLSSTEYTDNDNFPRQVYVREGRRLEGTYFFTANDAIPVADGQRPPVHQDAVTASHYALDSHACLKREEGRAHLDGFFGYESRPYNVPLGVMVPKTVSNLLFPVAVSGSHIGFSTMRMEPCWMALGEAAGVAAAQAIERGVSVQDIDVIAVQGVLADKGATLVYYSDVQPGHPDFKMVQMMGVRGYLPEWKADIDAELSEDDIRAWSGLSGMRLPEGMKTRREALYYIWFRLFAGEDLCRYADPLVGTADNGHTFPGACMPFGMVQPGPDSGNCRWEYTAGFNIADSTLIGFSQTHLNGTGCSDLGDILILPYSTAEPLHDTPYVKESLYSSPGYCSVSFRNGIGVEMTATPHVSLYRMDYAGGDRKLYVDFQNGNVNGPGNLLFHVLEASVDYEDGGTISGMLRTRNWTERIWYFVMEFSEPYLRRTMLPLDPKEKADKVLLEFAPGAGPLEVKIAMSTVSAEAARASMRSEAPAWNFDAARNAAHIRWHGLLSRVETKGTVEQKKNVYTGLYHLYVQPNVISDPDGSYRDAKKNVRKAGHGVFYSTFSLWDTYRAANPLYTILNPEMVDDFVLSMLEQYDAQGYLPIWSLWGQETHCMIGNHAVPSIVEAYLKGYGGFDAERAYRAVKASLTVNHPRSSQFDVLDEYGYYPFDIVERESVSRTMEMCYDDYCASVFAKALGHDEDAEYFGRRSLNWLNLFDPESKLVRGKDSKGGWRTPFDRFRLSHAATSGGDYTEGNAWQYTWHVQQDPERLVALLGGADSFETKLDSLFFLDNVSSANAGFVGDVTGLIGQYAHGNEPSHHVAYLYQFAGKPWKTEALIREIFDRFYRPLPDGLCGNDDCGQMSAWYIFSAMGFYPVDPVSLEYVLGAPQIEAMTLKLAGGRTFTVRAKGLSAENRYVESVTLNGKPLDGFKITHRDIMDGGVLEFTMTSEPGKRK